MQRFGPPILLLVLACATLAAVEPSPGTDLQQLRQRIGALQKRLAANEASRGSAADALRQAEKAISNADRAIAELDRQRSATQVDLNKANAEVEQVRALVDASRRRIADLLRARYENGQHEALRLLLNRQDPARLSRDLLYYRYIAQAQQGLSVKLQTQLNQLAAVSVQLAAKRQALAQLAAQKRTERNKLRTDQKSRKHILSKLSDQIDAQQSEIGKLTHDEQRLTTLVERLGAIIHAHAAKAASMRAHEAAAASTSRAGGGASTGSPRSQRDATTAQGNKPARDMLDASVDGRRFEDLRGSLHLPLRGDVVGKFGAPRGEGTSWKGVFIKSPSGQAVHAVAAGQVVFANWLRGFGNMIIVDHGDGYMSLYGTAEALLKRVGDKVHEGDEIATTGNSGGNVETGIYFELRHLGKPIDPLAWTK